MAKAMTGWCPFDEDCAFPLGYPEGYRDPPYDGTESGFAAVVMPARTEAILATLNAHLDSHGITGFRWEFA